MKHFKLASLASAAMLASGFAAAGTLQVTPIQYASETITAGAAMTAPVFSYALAAPISTGSQPVFTFRFTLDKAVWSQGNVTVANTYIVSQDNLFSLRPDTVSFLKADGTPSAAATDAATVVLTFTMRGTGGAAGPVGGAPTNANYTFPVGSNVVIGTNGAPPRALGTAAMVVPANSCTGGQEDVILTASMFNAIGQETAESAAGSPINFVKSNVYLRANAALEVTVGPAFIGHTEASRIDVTVAGTNRGRVFTATEPAPDVSGFTNALNIGQVVIAERGVFKDAASPTGLNYTVQGASFGTDGASLTNADGRVSVRFLNLQINGRFQTPLATAASFNNPFVYLGINPNCSAGGAIKQTDGTNLGGAASDFAAAMTTTSATMANVPIVAGVWTSTVSSTGQNRRHVNICLRADTVVGNTEFIPPAQFSIDQSSGKNTVAHFATESGSPICGTNLYNLRQNGVQFDLRNVVHKNSPSYREGWRSFVRIINTDASQTALVTGQVITSAGVVLAGGELTSIPPLGYRFLSTDQIQTALASTASGSYIGDGENIRLRLTAPVASMRAQSWLFNPANGNYMEASRAQGDEAPGNATTTGAVSESSRK